VAASRDLALVLALALLPACADFFGGRGDYGSHVVSRETWDVALDATHPRDGFTVELEAVPTERTALNWSELSIIAGWEASGVAEVEVALSQRDEALGSFTLAGSANPHSDAGMAELQREAPFVLDICVMFSLRDGGAMDIGVNGVEYSFDIARGGDFEPTVMIVDDMCGKGKPVRH
jgi:hypothetical protein